MIGIKQFLIKNIYFSTARNILFLFDRDLKKKSTFITFLVLSNVLIDLVGLSLIFPIILIALDIDVLLSNKYILLIYNYFEFLNTKSFLVFFVSSIFIFFFLKNLLSIYINKKQINFGLYVSEKFSLNEFRLFSNENFLKVKKNKSTVVERNIVTIPYFLVVFIVQPFILITTELIMSFIILFGLVIYDWKIVALIFFSITPPFIFAYFFSKNKLEYFSRKIIEITPQVNQWIYQSFFGFIDMKILGRENFFYEKFKSNIRAKNYNFGWQSLFKTIPVKIIEVSIVFLLIIIIMYGFFFVESRKEFSVFLTIFSVSLFRIIPLVNRVIQSILLLKAYEYVFEIINNIFPHFKNDKLPNNVEKFKSLELKNLDFGYNKINIIDNLSLNILKGDCIGIVGESGSGKTTLVNIILGFLKPNNGKVLYNDEDIELIKSKSWLKSIGYVQQGIYIIDGTIKENILFGDDEPDLEKLDAVCKEVNIYEFIHQQDNKYNTKIGELGSLISGGQKQRIGIARALYNNCEILVLDESTNSLDEKTEKEIINSLKTLNNNGLTLIIIAHNNKVLSFCNKIVKLEKGKFDVLSNQVYFQKND
jgi:ATP-binding cassette, subfamily B, bacterial PglK